MGRIHSLIQGNGGIAVLFSNHRPSWIGLPRLALNYAVWHTAIHSLRLQRLLWIYCPGYAGVCGNERADRLVSTAHITSGMKLGMAQVLRGLRSCLNMDRPEHHSIDHLMERGVEKGNCRHSTHQGRERSVFNQTNIGTVSRVTLGRLLRDRAEIIYIMGLYELYDAILSWNWNWNWKPESWNEPNCWGKALPRYLSYLRVSNIEAFSQTIRVFTSDYGSSEKIARVVHRLRPELNSWRGKSVGSVWWRTESHVLCTILLCLFSLISM